MPEEDTTTAPESVEPTPYEFPYPVPAELATASDDELRAVLGQTREHAVTLAGLSPAEQTDATITALQACRDLARTAAGVLSGRSSRAATAAQLAADIEADTDVDTFAAEEDDPDDEDDTAEDDTEAETAAAADVEPPASSVTASRGRRPAPAPRVRDVARRSPSTNPVPSRTTDRYMSMRASADVPGFASGQALPDFAAAARAMSGRLDQYPALTTARAGRSNPARRPVTVYDGDVPGRRFTMTNYQRHNVVEMRREFPADLRVEDGTRDGYAVAQHAANERRLPGGSLAESARLAVKAGKSLTAAVGWCAPSMTIYDLLETETLDGLLDVPELQTTRGGWQIPIDGGPDFSSIYNTFGNAGDTHLTEAEVAAGTMKVATEIPCPDYEDVRLDVDYYILTAGLLQRRANPEIVARFSRAAVVALAHKINTGVIAGIVAGSGSVNTIPSDASGDDAASALLSAVDLAIVDMKYRNRMSMGGTMEVVLPWWALVPVRAGLARRTGVAMLDVTDAQILAWFAERKAVPHLVYDWQDAFAGLSGGPGGSSALTHLPTTAEFVVYPAGTWTKAVQDVVLLDSVYDSTMLQTNQYTAVMAEDGWAMLQMAPLSRRYNVALDPSGVVACCDPVGS